MVELVGILALAAVGPRGLIAPDVITPTPTAAMTLLAALMILNVLLAVVLVGIVRHVLRRRPTIMQHHTRHEPWCASVVDRELACTCVGRT